MLKSLKLNGVGPVKNLQASFGERLNVLTGDNGLGKSFLLDVAFWVLTGTWPGGRVAIPAANGKRNGPTITYEVEGKKKAVKRAASFNLHNQSWKPEEGRPPMPGLVVYAAVDGGFAVWDPARNYWRNTATGQVVEADQPRAAPDRQLGLPPRLGLGRACPGRAGAGGAADRSPGPDR